MAWDFRKEEDVQQYLHNIGIEYRFGCYSEKKPEVCHLLGMYFDVIKKNTDQAKKVYKVNCDTSGWSHSCYKYAYMRDKEKKDDPAVRDEIIDYFTKGCDNGLNKSCYLAGVKLGAKAEQDSLNGDQAATFAKALQYMEKACDDRLGQACFNLSSIYFNGIPQVGIKPDFRKVFEYSVKGCEHMHINACANAALMLDKGEGVDKDPESAKKYRDKAKELYEAMNKEGLQFEEGVR